MPHPRWIGIIGCLTVALALTGCAEGAMRHDRPNDDRRNDDRQRHDIPSGNRDRQDRAPSDQDHHDTPRN
jgi:hypothetical protein